MAAETETLRFKIDQDEYDIPALDDMDMDEWQIIYDYSGLVLDDFAPAADRADEQVDGDEDGPVEKERQRRIGTPAFTTALLHIGYRRVHPDAKHDTVKKLVGGTKRLAVLEAIADAAPDEEEDAAVPPVLTPAPAPPSLPGSGDSNAAELIASRLSSAPPDALAERTGTSG